MIWTIVSFGLLVLLLNKAVLPPILAFLSQREQIIKDQINDAALNQKKSEELLSEYKKRLAEANDIAGRILERARLDGENLKQEIIKKAEGRAELVAQRAQQDLEREKNKIVLELKEKTAEIVALASGAVLRRTVTLEDNRRIIEESLKEARN